LSRTGVSRELPSNQGLAPTFVEHAID